MKRKLLKSFFAVVSVAALSSVSSGLFRTNQFQAHAAEDSRQGRVIVLGQTLLAYEENDRDVLLLPACNSSANQRVTKLKLRALRGDADVESVVVVFGNGERQQLRVRENINQGQETRWVDLLGEARCIRKIVVLGDTDNSSDQRALLRVFGLTQN
jgi:hypothetical protein